MEYRFTSSPSAAPSVRAAAESGKICEGYGAVFFRENDSGTEYTLWQDAGEKCVERIGRRAFNETIRRRDDVRILMNHDSSLLLGRTAAGTATLRVDDIGLFYSCTPADTTIANDALALISRGEISTSSFSFEIEDVVWSETKQPDDSWLIIREILQVRCFDCAPVTFAAYESTTAAVRSAQQPAPRQSIVTTYEYVTVPSNKSSTAAMRRRLEAIEADDRKWRASEAEAHRVRAAQYAAANIRRYPMDRVSVAARLREIERLEAGAAR